MKNLTEIRQHLFSVLRNAEEFREEKYKSYKNGVLISSLVAVSALVIIFYSLPKFGTVNLVSGIIIFFIAIILYFVLAYNNQRQFKTHFKSTALKQMIELMLPGISYDPNGNIDSNNFRQSGLYSTNFNRYSGEDFFSGKLNGLSFDMSELTVLRKTQSTSYSNGSTRTSTSTTTIFKGIFIIMENPSNHYGETYVLPDTAEKMFGSIGKFIQKNLGSVFQKGTMMYLENHSEFEKQYVVYTTEEAESMKLLNEKLAETIIELYNRWNIKPSFSFIGNKVYIGIPYRTDFLKVKLNKNLINEQQEILQDYYDEIALFVNVIQEIADDLGR